MPYQIALPQPDGTLLLSTTVIERRADAERAAQYLSQEMGVAATLHLIQPPALAVVPNRQPEVYPGRAKSYLGRYPQPCRYRCQPCGFEAQQREMYRHLAEVHHAPASTSVNWLARVRRRAEAAASKQKAAP